MTAPAGKHPFLSPEWLEDARVIREEFKGRAGAIPAIRMNQVITEVPFGDGRIEAHMDSTSGDIAIDLGHLDDAEVKITVPYGVAKAIFIDGDAQAGMQAFMSGYIKVDGDMTKLMAMQSTMGGIGDPAAVAAAAELQQRLREITA